MLNHRLAAARKVAAHLMPAEADLESSIVRNARLQIAIVEARQEAKAPKNLGAAALVHLADAGQALAAAWTSMTSAHSALHEDQRLAGLSTFAFGDVDETPTKTTGIHAEPVLREVA
ncbi:hypothetical protein [Sphingomonas immobilis]|jgi:hypothetical protein|uniref:Uncharacterized protein n=1 Tax=Sphingomonas immobilis TaxID=3063997 RepID=A0ABT8ZW77_9SPHN|nr:hypothetical protein [Sphingomonas sp. CA1-15]MDO7841829.1 hypothetical protein [Sphingomonas sp. CA1-15]